MCETMAYISVAPGLILAHPILLGLDAEWKDEEKGKKK